MEKLFKNLVVTLSTTVTSITEFLNNLCYKVILKAIHIQKILICKVPKFDSMEYSIVLSTPCCKLSTPYRLVVSKYEVPEVLLHGKPHKFFEVLCNAFSPRLAAK